MGFRSRALLTGVATGFLKAQNDRRDRMAERLQQLADNRALMDRERAKSEYTEATKAAAKEKMEWAQALEANEIDQDGNYTQLYYDKVATTAFADPNIQKSYGGKGFDAFKAEWQKLQPKKKIRQFKDPNEIQSNLTQVLDSIDTAQRHGSDVPVMTGLDQFLMSGVNKVRSLAGGKPSTVTPNELPESPTATFNPYAERQASSAPEEPYVAPQFEPVSEPDKVRDSQLVKGADGKYHAVQLRESGKVSVTATNLGFYDENDPRNKFVPEMEDAGPNDKWYLDGVEVDNVVKASYMNPKGFKEVRYGVRDEQGTFVPLPALSPFKSTTGSVEDFYVGDSNKKQAQLAQDVLYSSVRVTKSTSNIMSLYNPADYGTEKLFSDAGNAWTALWRVTNSGFSGGYNEKDKVLSAIESQEGFNSLPPEAQKAIKDRNYGDLAALSKEYNAKEMKETFDAFDTYLVKEEDQEILSEFRESALSAEVQPLVRDLLRMWTGGDKKPAWGASEHLLKVIKASSTPEKLIALARTYQEDAARTSAQQLQIKFDHSRFSGAQNPTDGFREMDLSDDIPAQEVRRDRRTGEYILIKSGKTRTGDIVRYVVPSNSQIVFDVKLPGSKSPMTDLDKNKFDDFTRLMDQYTEVLNVHGRRVN